MSPRYFGDRYVGPPSRPRPVEGGLKARSSRGAIGQSWWSRRFLDVLESFALGTRLTRGRSYARKGQVISLDVTPGEVAASVQGSRAKPYRVRIGLTPFPELVWARAEIALAEQALPSAKLLAGEVPPELEEIFAAAGAPLFPQAVRDLDQRCSCPDSEVPCKHLAATFYLLAESFDADPFLILRWRGRDRDELLSRLRTLRSAEDAATRVDLPESTPVAGAALALSGLDIPQAANDLARFWVEPVPLPDRPATLDVEPGLLLRQLPAPGAGLGGERLIARLRPAYERLAADPEGPRGST
jgi:uncharacterized Zn finger protein